MRSAFERVVGFAVVEEVAEAVYGILQEGSGSEDDESVWRALESPGDEESEASGFAEEGKEAEGFGGHTQGSSSQPPRAEGR